MFFSCCFKTLSWTSFFSIVWRLGAKKVDFGSPLAPSWVQNGVRNRPSGAKKAPIELDGLPILAPNIQDRFPERSWVPFWLILGPLGSKIMDFRMIFFTCSFWTDVAKINPKSAKICQESAKNQLVNNCT